jgi:hypothetical protein
MTNRKSRITTKAAATAIGNMRLRLSLIGNFGAGCVYVDGVRGGSKLLGGTVPDGGEGEAGDDEAGAEA